MANEIEIFGMRVRIVPDEKEVVNGRMACDACALLGFDYCANMRNLPCEDASGRANRHFEEITNESK